MNITERRKRLQELKEQEKSGKTSTATGTTTGSTIYSSNRAKRLAEIKQAEQQERLSTVSSELTSRIDTWFKNNENFVSNYKYRFSGFTGSYNDPYDSTINDWISSVTPQKANFDAEAASIKAIIEENRDYLDPDYVNSVLSALDNASRVQNDILNNASSAADYWSQFADQDEYLGYQQEYQKQQRAEGYKNKYSGASYEDILTALNTMSDGEEKEWLNTYKYDLVKSASDYGDRSSAGWNTYLDDEKKKAQAAAKAQDDEKWYEKIARWYGNAGYGDTTLPMGNSGQIIDDLRNDTSSSFPSSSWSDDQRNIFGYLYSTDRTEAYNYANYANEANNKAENEEKITAIESWATKNGFNGAVATLASVALMPFSLADTMSALTEYNATGKISTSATPLPGQISGAITSAISNVLNGVDEEGIAQNVLKEEIPVIGGKGWGDVYQLATSIANSMLSAYTQGGLGTYMVFFGSASASGIYEAKARKATDSQALTYGILNGLAEAAGEAFSAEHLLSMAGVGELKNFFFEVLKQAGIEASEEGVTTLLNNFTDQLVMGDKSNFNVLVTYYMTEEKISKEEAKKKAWKSMANDLAFDMLGGAISGGVSGGLNGGFGALGNAYNNTVQGKKYKNTYGADIGSALAGEGVEISPNSSFAQKMQKKVEGGKELSNRQVGKLVQQNESAMYKNDAAAIKSAAANRLTELGESGNVDIIATALAKQVTGESLTLSEKKAIKSSEYAQRVANELNPENIRSGGYSSAWAEKIGTDRINAAEYGRMIAELEHDATDSKFSPKTNVIRPPEEPEEEGATVSETENVQQVTGKLPASKADIATDRNVGDKMAQEPAVASEGLTESREEKGATYETPEVKDVQTGKIEASEGEHIADADKMVSEAEEESAVTLEAASAKYGAQAGAMVATYTEGQDVAKYDAAYSVAYNMGKSGVNLSYAMQSESTAYLTEKQRELAHAAGADASKVAADAQDAKNKGAINGKTGRRKGTVRGEGVTISDLKKSFNDTQNTAYKLLSTYAEATGIDIVLYKSEANADGKFEGAQGSFKWSEDTIYIDINAGLANIRGVNDLAKYTMMRTFSHEFSHFIEKWNPIWYNELRKVVFDTITEQGENVHDLIESKMSMNEGMSYDEASREVVAEALTDILPDANFVTELATNHKNVFEKLLEKLKEFVSDLKAYFASIGRNSSREANALKSQVGEAVHYFENIVKLFDRVAVDAVENYQMTVATEIETDNTDGGIVNGTEQAERSETVHTGRDSDDQSSESGTREEDADRSRVPEAVGEAGEGYGEVYARLEDNNDSSWLTDTANHITPAKGSELHKAQRDFAEQYGVECHIIKADAWKREDPATTYNGKVYVSESINEDTLLTLVPHEGTHTMKQRNFQPYMEFIDSTPDKLGLQTNEFDRLSDKVSKHRKIDIFDMTEKERTDFYDELNSFVYGLYKSGLIDDSELEFGWVREAFNDFDSYINELAAIHEQFKKENAPKKEANTNGENADNRSTVQQPQPDRQGASQVLEGLQTEDVPGDAQRGDSLGDAGERGQQTARDDNRPDAAGTRGRSGEGDSESGDLRRDDGLTPEAEKLHEEVIEQIAEQSTEQPRGRNFVIGESLDLPNGEKARYKANVEAIRLVKQLEAEGRYATEAEQTILSKYVGWGGLANAFDQRKSEWAKEYTELKELLSDEEYNSARGSTLNAHFTDISVIKAMYDGLAGLGFEGGRLLEPSSGVGNFVGAMPEAMSAKVKSWTMVELDGITGLIAKYLYPNADVRIQGFEKANIPDNFMDVAISNVPFGNYAITDKAYPKKVTSAIHNYFFAKSLDKVRPGGIVMFITSSYTMNAKDSTVRRYIMQRADLLGAIRLPDNAFKGNAGTEVVTDILVLKKRADNTPYAGEDFLEAPWTRIQNESYNGAYINSYFEAHPEMVLGTATMDGGMYRGSSLTYKALEGRGSLGDQIREAFKSIKGKMEYPARLSPERTNFAVERANKKTKENGLVVKDGRVYQNKGGELVEQTAANGAAERISGMLEIRDAARALLTYQQQGLNDAEIKKARTKLNKVYDAFVKKYGYINSQTNKRAFKEDPDCYSLFALENWNPETKKATKADIFSKNTIAPNRTITSAKDVAEGLIVSINQTGGVDAALIARLTGKTEADVTRELIDSRKAFKNRSGGLEAAETYLSGNVRAKLRDAEALAMLDGDYKNNVEALKSVMPADVGYQDIHVNAGATWIPNSVYSDFAAYILGGRNTEWRQDVDITRNPETGNFTVELKSRYLKTNAANTQKWGTSRRSFLDLFDAMLNSKSVVIKDKLPDGSFVINKDATAAANEKIENIQKEFTDWLWRDEGRRGELATLYNEIFNSIVTPKYNGDNLTVNGANAMKPLRPHQRNAVQRVISSGGNTLLAHKVGAGKTYEMAAAAMKLKELGLVKKPMFAVPKSLVAQWGNEFMDFFPTAKLLVAEASDFTAANRKVFMNRIANGEYDAVIVSYEQFEKLPMSDDFTRELYQEQIDSIVAAIEEAKAEKGDKSLSVKDLEKKRKSLQAKIDKLTDKAKDEDNIDFEQLGVDSLFVDEAHNFKNLFYTTSMTNVSGLGNKDGSKRAFDLYTKVRYLQQLNGGRGIVFATATPVMNSMSEMYIMQKYLQPDLINQLGLSTFDAWAKQFGEVVNGVEIKPSGQGYRVKQSFSRFKNMSELQLLFRNFADVLTDIPGLKIPKMKGGKVNVVVCEPGQFQQDYMKELEKRADNVKNVDPSEDNMLKITSDGRKISYTQRMIDPSLPYEEGCKINRCAENVIKAYNESKDIKGTQLIFCDMATPKGKSSNNETATEDLETDNDSVQLYDDIKAQLRKGGIPAKEIAFIHEADTDQKKKKLFADVNDGKVRVLIGSTGKMGVGMNAQKRVVAIHHLDAPWRPGDVEQRNGRAFRQGNINDEVECFTYVTEGSFDARLWDILERKQNFINQIMNGESVGREAEDTGEVTLSAAEVKALASGSPLILEQVQLDTDIKKLESLYRAHLSAVRSAKARLLEDEGVIATLEKYIEAGKKDLPARVDTYSEGKFSITVGKTTYTDKKEAGAALMALAISKAAPTEYTTIGRFAGFDVRVIKTHEGIKGLLSGNQGYSFNTYPERPTYMITHLSAVAESIEEKIKLWEHNLAEKRADVTEQEKLIAEPFAKEAELESKRARYNEIMEILNPKEEQSLDSMDEDTVQEQSREYLGEEQEQQRTDTLTDREVLQMAAEKLGTDKLTEAERGALDIFKKRLAKLEALQTERTEQGRLYKEQQFGAKVDRAAAAQTLNRMHVLDDRIKAANAEVLSLEDKAVLGDVLKKARKVVEDEERQHGAEILKRWRDRTKNAADIKKYRDRIKKDFDTLQSWITKPDHKDVSKHVPDAVKDPVIELLELIDFSSKQLLRGKGKTEADKTFDEKLAALQKVLASQTKAYGENYSDYIDLPPGYVEKMDEYVADVKALVDKVSGKLVINEMTSEQLREFSHILKTLRLYITQMNSFHNNAMYRHVYEAGNDLINELSSKKSDKGKTGKARNFVEWQNIRPALVWERFGRPGIAIRDELQAGQDKYGFNAREIVNFTQKAFTSEEVRAYREKLHTFNIGGEKVTMRVSHMMGLYLLSKQEDSLRHILKGGIRVGNFQQRGLSKKIYSSDSHILTQTDIDLIVGKLTVRQKAVADALQKFMAEKGAEWGNEVSFKRFGEALFGELNYYPIAVDKLQVGQKEEFPEGASLYALLNKSFTKARNKEAANRIMLYDVFDVFANHMSSMAQYNALAIPVLDATKWLNYQQKTSKGELIDSVKDELTRVFGAPVGNDKGHAVSFIENILKDINGTSAQGSPYDNLYLKILHNYNISKVSGNLKSALLQPTAIIRAGNVINAKSILSALNPADIKTNTEEMLKYSGIAVWKDLGFYDVNISRGMHELITNDTTGLQKLTEKSLWLAETLDRVTWSAIWGAAKKEVTRKYKLTPKDAGFYELVTKTFEEVIYKTQVVDSVLTKSELMRSKGLGARTVSSFMSEPVTTLSALINVNDKVRREGWSKHKDEFFRSYANYTLQALFVALAGAIPYMWRDDDEYEEWYEKFLAAAKSNFFSELDPFSKMPVVAEAWESLLTIFKTAHNAAFDTNWQIYSQNTAVADIVADLSKGVETLIDRLTNENTKYTHWTWIYALIEGGSAIFGAPFASYVKEISGMWNNTVGVLYPDLKLKTYDAGERNEIKYAYLDKHLTEEEATKHLLEKGVVKNKHEAFFEIEGWKYGTGYSKFGAYYDAILAEDEEQIELYYDNLYGEKISEGSLKLDAIDSIHSGLKTQAKEAYIDGEIDKETVYNVLVPYADMSEDDIKTELEKWEFEIEYGFSWSERAKGYRRGEITETELKNAVMEIEDEELSDADAYIRLLNLEMANQDYDITADIASKYFEFAEPAGIDLGIFIDFKYQIKGIEGDKDRHGNTISGSKKAKIMNIINSLPLTKAQKDALYYASGYEKSTIREAPWR